MTVEEGGSFRGDGRRLWADTSSRSLTRCFCETWCILKEDKRRLSLLKMWGCV